MEDKSPFLKGYYVISFLLEKKTNKYNWFHLPIDPIYINNYDIPLCYKGEKCFMLMMNV